MPTNLEFPGYFNIALKKPCKSPTFSEHPYAFAAILRMYGGSDSFGIQLKSSNRGQSF